MSRNAAFGFLLVSVLVPLSGFAADRAGKLDESEFREMDAIHSAAPGKEPSSDVAQTPSAPVKEWCAKKKYSSSVCQEKNTAYFVMRKESKPKNAQDRELAGAGQKDPKAKGKKAEAQGDEQSTDDY